MLKELNRLLYLSSNIVVLFLLCLSCKDSYRGDFYIIESYKKDNNFIKLYSPDCYIYNKNGVFQIENKLHYIDGKLAEVINPSTESLIYYKLGEDGEIPKVYEQYNSLSVKRKGNNIFYLNSSYPIIEERNDSIFVKTKDTGKYLIFIGDIKINE
ncbi:MULTISPECIES: hypothetical protein [Chryseobacterium]|uniref:hypothetical protein n=1 Tax=Chryseobacterium TaxID=59732 RepID=UPI0031DCC833